MKINSLKVVSGGQTGVDIIALEVAHSLGIQTGGFAANRYMTSHGINLDLKLKYNLIEVSGTLIASYICRSIKNVDMSDGTIAFRLIGSSGTDKTIGYCKHKKCVKSDQAAVSNYKPVLVIKNVCLLDINSIVEDCLAFIKCFGKVRFLIC